MNSPSLKAPWIEMDGSHGEGGGQILRSALALSSLTGQPFSIKKIRAGRKVPGLRPQHLMGIEAMVQMTGAQATHAKVGSSELSFVPGTRPQGDFFFDIQTAGATSLLLHALVYPLAFSPTLSSLRLRGGTHVEQAPTFHYLEAIWLPSLRACGWPIDLALTALGCYPKGGGAIEAKIRGEAQPTGLFWTEAEAPEEIVIFAVVGEPRAKTPSLWEGEAILKERSSERFAQIAQRMTDAAREELQGHEGKIRCLHLHAPSSSVGVCCHVFCTSEKRRGGATVWGEKGRPAEEVGRQAAKDALLWLRSPATVDAWLADQLLLPLSLAKTPSSFIAPEATGHLETNCHTIQTFFPSTQIRLSPHPQGQGAILVEIEPAGTAISS